MRTVKTTSGVIAVQVVWSSRRGSRETEHLGSAHDEAELEALKAAAQQRTAAGQLELALGLEPARIPRALGVTGSPRPSSQPRPHTMTISAQPLRRTTERQRPRATHPQPGTNSPDSATAQRQG